MQFLSPTTELVGNIDSKERYLSYLFLVKWCTDNIEPDQWELEYDEPLLMCGTPVASAFRIKNMRDAMKFAHL